MANSAPRRTPPQSADAWIPDDSNTICCRWSEFRPTFCKLFNAGRQPLSGWRSGSLPCHQDTPASRFPVRSDMSAIYCDNGIVDKTRVAGFDLRSHKITWSYPTTAAVRFEPRRKQVETWQRSELTDVRAKVVIRDVF